MIPPPRAGGPARALARRHDPGDHLGEGDVGVPAAHAGGGLRHLRDLLGVGEHRQHVAADPVGVQLGVLDQQAAVAGHDGLGVEPLLAVADRQRDVRGGQPDRGQLGAGDRARPAHREVGRGVREVHAVAVREHDVGRVVGGDLGLAGVLGADDVQDLDAGGAQRGHRVAQRAVERARALGPAEDQQRGQVGAQAEMRAGLVAHAEPVERGDLPAQRDADHLGVRERGVGGGHRDVLGEPRAQAVGQAGPWVRLVHDDRDLAAPRGEVAGGRHVAAEADQHVGLGAVEDARRRVDRTGETTGHGQQARCECAG